MNRLRLYVRRDLHVHLNLNLRLCFVRVVGLCVDVDGTMTAHESAKSKGEEGNVGASASLIDV